TTAAATHAGRMTHETLYLLPPLGHPRQVSPVHWGMRVRLLLASAAFVASSASPASAQRVPATVTPEHYDLAFVVDLPHERFDGTETIRVSVAEPTARVVLHAVELDLREVTIGTGASAQKATVTLDEANQTATLTVPRALPRGSTEVHVRFAGVLNSQLRGFYISKTKQP